MLTTTTSSVDGYTVSEYLGVVSGASYDYLLGNWEELQTTWENYIQKEYTVWERVRLNAGMTRQKFFDQIRFPILGGSEETIAVFHKYITSEIKWVADTQSAIDQMQEAARELGANAILGVTLSFISPTKEHSRRGDFQSLNEAVRASGTAVIIRKGPVP